MTDSITVTGVVGSDPRLHVTAQGLAITSFRLASTRRYFDRVKSTWEDGETNWYTVSAV
jgi:single-strand DNA-binding protein